MSSPIPFFVGALLITFDGYVTSAMSTPCNDDVISCPCGIHGNTTVITIKRCTNSNTDCVPCDGKPYTRESICVQFKYCLTCDSNRDGGCKSCPEGVFGKRCLHEQTCGQPPNLLNGFYEGDDWVENKAVRYYCHHRWILTGSSELVCVDGRWKGVVPKCALSCGPPPNLSNGRFGASNWTEGGQAAYRCRDNWFMEGDPYLVCQNAQWIGQIPTCLQGCGNPPELTNGRYLGSNWANGDSVQYTCNSGWSLIGNPELVCHGSQWAGALPSCVQGCGNPPELTNGRYLGSNWANGDSVQYTCNSGWSLIGNPELVCHGSHWAGALPSCVLNCGQPPNLHNGRYEGNNWAEGDRVQYYCNTRWTLSGDSQLTCRNGQWVGTRPTCGALGCGQPPNLHNGRYEGNNWTEGDRVQYFCNTRWTLSGDSQLTCRNGQWVGTRPTCVLNCGQPPNLHNGRYEGNNWAEGDRVQYYCNTRWTLSGDSQLTCRNGQWVGTRPTCGALGCGQPPNLHNGRYEGNNWAEGDRVQYYCNTRWTLSGDSQLTCRNGQWAGARPTCDVTCPKPSGGNMVISPVIDMYTVDTEVSLSCKTGFTSGKTGATLLRCQSSGEWNSSYPSCIKTVASSTTCPVPGHPHNGEVTIPSGQTAFRHGQRVVFTCDKGYILSGSTQLVCNSDGTWSANFPRCIKVTTCADPGIPKNGKRTVALPDFQGNRRAGSRISQGNRVSRQRFGARTTSNSARGAIPAGRFQAFTKLTYSCDSFFSMVGSTERRCESSGEWSGIQPFCQPVCGKLNRIKAATIINGNLTRVGDWPWQAFIAIRRLRGQYFGVCAGTLLNDRWVATAAHCVANRQPENIRVYMGKYFRDDQRDDSYVQRLQVSKIQLHGNYNPLLLDFDIALLRLSTKVAFTARVNPICIPSLDSNGERFADSLIRPGAVLTVTGWGHTENGTVSEVLRVAQVRTISNQDCQNTYFRSGLPIPVTGNMFCAGHPDGRADTCYGDSGGPTMAISGSGTDKKWYLVGLVSWGSPIDCGVPNQYGGYTRISRFLGFIRNTTGV